MGEDEEGESIAKRAKGEDGTSSPAPDESPAHDVPEVKETEEVKDVTQGVNEVELEDGKPETVPLPASPPPEGQDADAIKEDTMAVLPTISPISPESTTSKDANVPPASTASAVAPPADTFTTSDPVASTKATRKTRKLPSKTAKPSSKAANKVEKAIESNGKTSAEVVDLKKDDGSA